MDSPAGEEILFPDLVVAGGGGRCPPLFPLAPRHLADLPPTTVFMAASYLGTYFPTLTAPHEMSKRTESKDPVFAVKSLRKGRGKNR